MGPLVSVFADDTDGFESQVTGVSLLEEEEEDEANRDDDEGDDLENDFGLPSTKLSKFSDIFCAKFL